MKPPSLVQTQAPGTQHAATIVHSAGGVLELTPVAAARELGLGRLVSLIPAPAWSA